MVMTPSLPTRSNASPISSPMTESCAEMVATPAISARSSTGVAASSRAAETAATAGRLAPPGGGGGAAAPAAAAAAGPAPPPPPPRRDVLHALVHQRLRQHGRRR